MTKYENRMTFFGRSLSMEWYLIIMMTVMMVGAIVGFAGLMFVDKVVRDTLGYCPTPPAPNNAIRITYVLRGVESQTKRHETEYGDDGIAGAVRYAILQNSISVGRGQSVHRVTKLEYCPVRGDCVELSDRLWKLPD